MTKGILGQDGGPCTVVPAALTAAADLLSCCRLPGACCWQRTSSRNGTTGSGQHLQDGSASLSAYPYDLRSVT